MTHNTIQSARLILIPTPIEESLPLEPMALEILKHAAADSNTMILVEEHKVARIRWLHWGLPRETIERFVLFNEHNQEESISKITSELKAGKRAVLMSDGGLPAFCDPGQRLVRACHEQKIPVSASPFPNSISLAIALSGISHKRFYFAGFLSSRAEDRKQELDQIHRKIEDPIVVMDTPYRLQALLKDIEASAFKNRVVFLATGLNSASEHLFFGHLKDVIRLIDGLNKVEFILVIDGKN